jgi:hypothetical protein
MYVIVKIEYLKKEICFYCSGGTILFDKMTGGAQDAEC